MITPDSALVRDILAVLVQNGYPEATAAKAAEVASALHVALTRSWQVIADPGAAEAKRITFTSLQECQNEHDRAMDALNAIRDCLLCNENRTRAEDIHHVLQEHGFWERT